MTEYAIDLNAMKELGSFENMNGHIESDVPTSTPQGARVDPVRGVFITSRGEEIELADKPVSFLIVERIQNAGKPKIPLIEVTILGRKQSEYFAGHEGYQARLKEWEEEANTALMRYLFVVGTKGQPPQEFIDEQMTFFPGATAQELKYLWIASRLPDDDLSLFTEAILGKAIPTAKGLAESADSFRG